MFTACLCFYLYIWRERGREGSAESEEEEEGGGRGRRRRKGGGECGRVERGRGREEARERGERREGERASDGRTDGWREKKTDRCRTDGLLGASSSGAQISFSQSLEVPCYEAIHASTKGTTMETSSDSRRISPDQFCHVVMLKPKHETLCLHGPKHDLADLAVRAVFLSVEFLLMYYHPSERSSSISFCPPFANEVMFPKTTSAYLQPI